MVREKNTELELFLRILAQKTVCREFCFLKTRFQLTNENKKIYSAVFLNHKM